MGKRAEQAKKRRRLAGPEKLHFVKPQLPLEDSRSTSPSSTLVASEDLETTIYVLKTLAQNPEGLADKSMKELKRATYDLQRVIAEGATVGSSLTARISSALQDYRFTDALVLLFEMHARRIPPKLGALQRWVRECDATSKEDGTPGDPEALRCLDMMLRIAGVTTDRYGQAGEGSEAIVRRKSAWRARGEVEGEVKIWELMQKKALFSPPHYTPPKEILFRSVHHLPGHLRRPPNLYSSTVYASSPSAIALTPEDQRRRTPSKVEVPGVPGAFLVLDVFTPEECLQIVQAAVNIGFERDEAAAGSAKLKTSILAHNFLWLADKPFLDNFYGRLLPFVPTAAPLAADRNGGGKVRGINARFRVYQYNEKQVYRPHIDGAWPAAGLDPVTGEYLHESSPLSDPLWSRYTLLVYLNSDIPDDTGCTTFFLPSKEIGVLEATPVKPIQGAVLCFPHGDTQGSLLHEGSAVGPNGGKLVIRTDLLYEAKGFGAFKPPASVWAGC
ncbi:hypothetical protein FRB94_007162 [Tulasnella sp. JGI-2019a]|nr:hypothetical protein FRB93_012483 [Tulasnella sp. JGI-2019a]KAG9011969.1 hypothetical protein FRB94_007162 [Tulasnella sp. JGI-2019a]KAG9036258.1 hypothetical protein FRB95_009406 [Tulasnella sp. JGI-2019a]